MGGGPLWKLNVLGRVTVSGPDLAEPRDVRMQSARLLAALAATGGPVARDALYEAVWPNDLSASSGALRVAVNRARQYFDADGPAAIIAKPTGYQLDRTVVAVDVETWQHLVGAARDQSAALDERAANYARAAKLWRGTPFDGLLEDWRATALISALEIERTAAAADELAVLRQVDPEAAAHRAPLLVRVAPLHEPIVVQAMDALTAVGHGTGAMALARSYRERLRDELGLLPSSALHEAEMRCLAPSSHSPLPPTVAAGPTIAEGHQPATPEPDDAAECVNQAFEYQAKGNPAEASRLFSRAVALADPVTEADLIVNASLGGSTHASLIGGDPDRQSRLRVALRRVPTHPRRDELVAELVVEATNSRLPLTPELHAEIDRIVADSSSPGHALALRWRVADWQIDGRASSADALLLADIVRERQGADVHHASALLCVAVGVAMACAELDLAEELAAEFEFLGVATGQARALWQATAFRAVLAEMRGRADLADELAARALTIGAKEGMSDAEATFGLHLVGRAWRSGSLAGFAPSFAAAVDRYRLPIWQMFRGVAEFDAGNEAEARRMLTMATPEAGTQRHHFTPAALALGARLAVMLGDVERSRHFAELLERRNDHFVLVGYGGPCLGPIASLLADAAELAGDGARAAQHRADATTICREAGAVTWLPTHGL